MPLAICGEPISTTLASYRVRLRTALSGGSCWKRYTRVADRTADGDDQVRQELAARGGQTASGGERPVWWWRSGGHWSGGGHSTRSGRPALGGGGAPARCGRG